MVGEHGKPDDHGADHGADPGHDDHDMDEGHGGEALGPIDTVAWGAAVLGIVLGLVVFVALLLAVS